MTTRIVATVDPRRSRIEARDDRGHLLHLDTAPPEGDDSATSPKETLLAALAACTAMDVASILRKKRQPAATYEVVVTGESAGEHPKVFTAITVEHHVTGAVEAEAVRRSVELSSTRYCPVSAMLSKAVTIEHRYLLTAADGTEHGAVVAVTGPDGAAVVQA